MRSLHCLPIVLIPCLALASPPTAEQILAEAKIASGGAAWDQVHSLSESGRIALGGLNGSGEQVLDLDRLRFRLHVRLGPDEETQGFDGQLAWVQSRSGEVTQEDSAAERQRNISDAYGSAYGWWYPQRWPAVMETQPPCQEAGHDYSVVRITPKGGQAFDLWVETASGLIDRTVFHHGSRDIVHRFLDYREVSGLKLPFRLVNSDGDPHYDQTVVIDQISPNVAISDALFTKPQQLLNDFTVRGDGQRVTLPFDLLNNHIYLNASVNGHALSLLFDTGAQNILTPEAAAAAGIQSQGALEATGVGNKSVDAGIATVDKLVIGDAVELRNQAFSVLPMPGFSSVEGRHIDGTVGYEVLKRMVVSIDYAAHQLHLMQPDAFSPANAGTAIALSFDGTTPMVDGSVDGIPGQFELDTGSRAALTLWNPYVAAHHLLDHYVLTPETTIGWGVGGKASGRVARARTLMIGPVSVPAPVMALSTDGRAPTTNDKNDGNVGGEVLRRFTVTLDYGHQKLYLRPNADFTQAFSYDRSGLWINADPSGATIVSVMTGSPAQQAGLEPGDLIRRIDGNAVKATDLVGIRALLRDTSAGQSIHLEIDRAGSSRTVDLVLRDLIPLPGVVPGKGVVVTSE